MKYKFEMDLKKFLILGGYGNTGLLIAEYLLQETDCRIVLAGRNIEKAESFTASLNHKFKTNRVSAARVDAANTQSLNNAFEKVDFVIVASSTSEYVRNVANAVLSARIDYLDVQYSSAKVDILKSMKEEIERAGCCFITEGGFHPGLPAALVRYAASYFDRMEKANVGSVIKINWKGLKVSDSTVEEMVKEILDFQPLSYKNGKWVKSGWRGFKKFNFGLDFGEQYSVPMFLEEMHPLPEMIPSLKETGFFVGGFNWFVDYLVMPIGAVALKILRQKAVKPTGKIMSWGLKAFCSPPYGTVLLLEASGWKDEKYKTMRVKLYHEDGYILTAIPVVACLLQYLDGSIRKPGLWLQANVVEPNRMLSDMERLGVNVRMGSNLDI